MGAAGMEPGRGQPSLQGLAMPQQRLQHTGPNTDILEREALGQGNTLPRVPFPCGANLPCSGTRGEERWSWTTDRCFLSAAVTVVRNQERVF